MARPLFCPKFGSQGISWVWWIAAAASPQEPGQRLICREIGQNQSQVLSLLFYLVVLFGQVLSDSLSAIMQQLGQQLFRTRPKTEAGSKKYSTNLYLAPYFAPPKSQVWTQTILIWIFKNLLSPMLQRVKSNQCDWDWSGGSVNHKAQFTIS